MNDEPTDTTADKPTQPGDATSVEHNKAVSRRWIDVFNERDDAAEADVLAPDYVAHAPASLEPAPLGPEAWTRFLAGFVDGFPDLRLTVEDAVGEGDLVAQRVHFAGTHTGEFQGLPPTHRKVSFSGLELNRFVGGKVAEHWFQLDALTLLQQLGLVVVPGPRLLPRVLGHQLKKLRKKDARVAPGAFQQGDRQLDFHPGMGMRWEITESTEDTSGALFESTNWLDSRMPGPPPHVHPNSEESFEVLEGSLDVFKDGAWTTLRPGETASVPSGAPHTLRNGSDEPAKIITRIRPAGRSEEFFRHMHTLIREGKLKRLPPNEPRSAVYAAMLFDRYPDEIRATGPLNSVFKALALIGKALRLKL